jgi:hypothetical protein
VMVEKYAGHPIPLPEGTRIESVKVDGISAEWIHPPGADAERAVLFLHGGAYILGSLKSHRDENLVFSLPAQLWPRVYPSFTFCGVIISVSMNGTRGSVVRPVCGVC